MKYFQSQLPANLRCQAVLLGLSPGKILTDNPERPTWAAVWEAGDGILYLGGKLDSQLLERLIVELRRDGEVLVGFWNPDDPLINLLPTNYDWSGSSYDFLDRPLDGSGLEAYQRPLPAGYAIREIDQNLLEGCLWYEDTLRRFGGSEAFFERGKGFCLLHQGEIISEAYAGSAVMGVRELGAITKPEQRGRGYATLVCAQLVHACELAGERTYWNCATTNLASVAVAHKLGYRTIKQFHWLAWSQLNMI